MRGIPVPAYGSDFFNPAKKQNPGKQDKERSRVILGFGRLFLLHLFNVSSHFVNFGFHIPQRLIKSVFASDIL